MITSEVSIVEDGSPNGRVQHSILYVQRFVDFKVDACLVHFPTTHAHFQSCPTPFHCKAVQQDRYFVLCVFVLQQNHGAKDCYFYVERQVSERLLFLVCAFCAFPNNTHTQETQRHSDTETQRHSDTETQRHRDTEAQRHRNTETQRHRDTDTETLRHRLTETQRHRHAQRQRHRHADTDTKKHRHRDAEKQRHKDTETQRHTETETQTYRQRETETQRN